MPVLRPRSAPGFPAPLSPCLSSVPGPPPLGPSPARQRANALDLLFIVIVLFLAHDVAGFVGPVTLGYLGLPVSVRLPLLSSYLTLSAIFGALTTAALALVAFQLGRPGLVRHPRLLRLLGWFLAGLVVARGWIWVGTYVGGDPLGVLWWANRLVSAAFHAGPALPVAVLAWSQPARARVGRVAWWTATCSLVLYTPCSLYTFFADVSLAFYAVCFTLSSIYWIATIVAASQIRRSLAAASSASSPQERLAESRPA